MGAAYYLDPVDVVVVLDDVGAFLLEPKLYMLRITGCPRAPDAVDDVNEVGAPAALVIQRMTTLDTGHGLALMVSTCAYEPAAADCATCCVCCC